MEFRHRKPKRDRVAIIAEVLEMAEDGALKSEIRYRVGLNAQMFDSYVGFMVKSRLLETVIEKKRLTFQVTNKGTEFLRLCHEISTLLATEENKKPIPYGIIEIFPTGLP